MQSSSSEHETVESFPAELMPAAARPLRVLVIDDDEFVQRAVRRVLKDHALDQAESGPEALALLARGVAYDVVLLDLHLPGMRGIDVFEALVAAHPRAARRVVVLSGGAFDVETVAFLDRTDLPRIDKPFDPATLRAAISARARGGGSG